MDAGNFFEHEDVGDGVEAGAAPVFGHEHAATAECAEFLDDVEGKMVGALPVFDVRADFGVHEFADGVADEELVIGEGEVQMQVAERKVTSRLWEIRQERNANPTDACVRHTDKAVVVC